MTVRALAMNIKAQPPMPMFCSRRRHAMHGVSREVFGLQ
jgi:hypothetical protein